MCNNWKVIYLAIVSFAFDRCGTSVRKVPRDDTTIRARGHQSPKMKNVFKKSEYNLLSFPSF